MNGKEEILGRLKCYGIIKDDDEVCEECLVGKLDCETIVDLWGGGYQVLQNGGVGNECNAQISAKIKLKYLIHSFQLKGMRAKPNIK